MYKVSICVAAVAVLAGSALAGFDGNGTISQNAFSSGNGGEFTITPSAGFVGVTNLFADLSGSSFQTFCLETNEQFSPGNSYGMNINTVAIMGGSGGPSYPLQPETAYLYWHFRNGSLTGYDYGAGRQASAGALQRAIWYIQGNQSGGANNAFVALATSAVSGGSWTGIGDVRVLNVYRASNNALGQDQLTIIPTPSAAVLMGLGGLAAMRRRR